MDLFSITMIFVVIYFLAVMVIHFLTVAIADKHKVPYVIYYILTEAILELLAVMKVNKQMNRLKNSQPVKATEPEPIKEKPKPKSKIMSPQYLYMHGYYLEMLERHEIDDFDLFNKNFKKVIYET